MEAIIPPRRTPKMLGDAGEHYAVSQFTFADMPATKMPDGWDDELIKFGRRVRALSGPRVSVTPDPWKAQLEEARAEWRRRHPKVASRYNMSGVGQMVNTMIYFKSSVVGLVALLASIIVALGALRLFSFRGGDGNWLLLNIRSLRFVSVGALVIFIAGFLWEFRRVSRRS